MAAIAPLWVLNSKRRLQSFAQCGFTTYLTLSLPGADALTPAGLYEIMPVSFDVAVFMQALLPSSLGAVWQGFDRHYMSGARESLRLEVYQWLGSLVGPLFDNVFELVNEAETELRRQHFLSLLPAVRGFEPKADSIVADLPLDVAVPVALACIMLLARSDVNFDNFVDDEVAVTMDDARCVYDHLRACFTFDGMLHRRASIWSSEQQAELEQLRRTLAEAICSLQTAAGRSVD